MIYFIQDGYWDNEGSCIKIGFSRGDIKVRMSALQIGNPKELNCFWSMPGDVDREKQVQELFGEFHIRGEWFSYSEGFADLWEEFAQAGVDLARISSSEEAFEIKLTGWIENRLNGNTKANLCAGRIYLGRH